MFKWRLVLSIAADDDDVNRAVNVPSGSILNPLDFSGSNFARCGLKGLHTGFRT